MTSLSILMEKVRIETYLHLNGYTNWIDVSPSVQNVTSEKGGLSFIVKLSSAYPIRYWDMARSIATRYVHENGQNIDTLLYTKGYVNSVLFDYARPNVEYANTLVHISLPGWSFSTKPAIIKRAGHDDIKVNKE